MNTAKKTRNSSLRHWRRDVLSGGLILPVAPGNFAAEADGGYSSISLSWTYDDFGQDGFRIYRSIDGGLNYLELATVSSSTKYYQDTGLTRGNTYYYYVVAYFGFIESTRSSVDFDTIFSASALIASDGYAVWDMDEDVFTDAGVTPAVDGNAVQQVNDQTGNGRHLTQTSAAAKMTYKTNILNGHNVVRGLGGDYMQNSVLADWKFLHDGSPFTTFIVYKTTANEPNSIQVLLATSSGSTANIGYFLSSDDRDSVPRYHTSICSILRGTAGVGEVGVGTLYDSVRCGRWHVTVTSRQGTNGDLIMENDGHFGGYASGVADGSPSASNPTSPLTIAATGTGTNTLSGDIAYVAIFNELTDTERRQFSQYLSERFDREEYQYFEPSSVLLAISQEPTYDYVWAGGIAFAPNGNLVVAYTQGQASNAIDYLKVIISSDKGLTWGVPITVWDKAVDGGGTLAYTATGLTTIGNNLYIKSNGTGELLAMFSSSDNGLTWSSPVSMGGNGDITRNGGGPIIVLQNGDWISPYYYQFTGDGDLFKVAVLRSQNQGATWTHLSIAGDSQKYIQGGVCQLDNGDVIYAFRDTVPSGSKTIRHVVSGDNCATWGAVSTGILDDGDVAPLKTQDNNFIALLGRSTLWYSRGFATIYSQVSSNLDRAQNGWDFGLSPNDGGSGLLQSGYFCQGNDGDLYAVFALETIANLEGDLMFARAPRGL